MLLRCLLSDGAQAPGPACTATRLCIARGSLLALLQLQDSLYTVPPVV